MGFKGALRAMEAAQRRQEREAQKTRRELERRAKEQAKLSLIEQATLEVETYENKIDLLLSIHKEQSDIWWDWLAFATALPPLPPARGSYHEQRARQEVMVLPPDQKQKGDSIIDQARGLDERGFAEAMQTYSNENSQWERLKNLSCRILAGEHDALKEALIEFNPFSEINGLGSQLRFKVHNRQLLICFLKVRGVEVIPPEVKSLTATGKVSARTMPKVRYHELYQDHICGCILRVAREVFALLPVQTILITASVDTVDSSTGAMVEQPVLSAAIPRDVLLSLEFERLDPSDAMENFLHHGDFKASRKAGAFGAITPLTPNDVIERSVDEREIGELIASVKTLRREFEADLEKANRETRQISEEEQLN
jgi:hypothetical protein